MRCCKKLLPYKKGDDYDTDSDISPDLKELKNDRKRSCACKVLIWTSSILFALIVVAFLAIWVIFPLVFMNTISIQRLLMFPNFDQPRNPEFENYKKYGAQGVRNMYLTVDDLHNTSRGISLGVWQILPEENITATDFADQLKNSRKPICLYFHGNSGTRIYPLPMYQKLRKFFHILAVDYRSYGDSTEALLTEDAVVNDLVQFYYKVLELTNTPDVYFWGHSLGAALSTHALKRITEENTGSRRLPRALMLEAPFSSMRDEIPVHPFGKLFAWMPWFDVTVLDPLDENGFKFLTTKNILKVNCPIMIIHAMDDSVIPYSLGEKLAKVAENQRNMTSQGDVTLHLVPAQARCNHLGINDYPELPKFIG